MKLVVSVGMALKWMDIFGSRNADDPGTSELHRCRRLISNGEPPRMFLLRKQQSWASNRPETLVDPTNCRDLSLDASNEANSLSELSEVRGQWRWVVRTMPASEAV